MSTINKQIINRFWINRIFFIIYIYWIYIYIYNSLLSYRFIFDDALYLSGCLESSFILDI
jgi:hypothetical protein